MNQSIIIDTGTMVWLDSYRINNYINASLHYLVMGRDADAVGDAHAAMLKRRRDGEVEWFDARSDLYFKCNGNTLRLREELYFVPTPSILDNDLALIFSTRDGQKRVRIPLNAERWSLFIRLLPMLSRRIPECQVREAFDDGQWSFVIQMIQAGFLTRVPSMDVLPAVENSVTLIGHSCLLFETPKARVLVDPIFTVRYRPEYSGLDVLDSPIDAILISHPHWDHFNIDTLLHVDRSTTVIIPRLRRGASIVNPDMSVFLREFGFKRIRTLNPWECTEVGDILIQATPFYGESSGPEGPQDWMTYLVELGGRRIFGAVDSCHDSFGSTDMLLHEIRESSGDIDLLFAPSTGFHYPISVFTRRPFFAGTGREQFSGDPYDAVRWTTISGASVLVPYAMFHYNAQDLESDQANAYRTGSLPILSELVRAHPNGPLQVLFPGKAIAWEYGGKMLCKTRTKGRIL